MKTLDFETAKELKYGQILHFNKAKNSDGTCQRWRVNGKVKLWKRAPNRIEIPLKHALKTHYTMNENDLGYFHKAEDCPLNDSIRLLTIEEAVKLNLSKEYLCKHYKLKTFDYAIPQNEFEELNKKALKYGIDHVISVFVYNYTDNNYGMLFPLTEEALKLMKEVFPTYLVSYPAPKL